MVILCGDIVGYVLNVQFSVILYRRVDAPVRLFAVGKERRCRAAVERPAKRGRGGKNAFKGKERAALRRIDFFVVAPRKERFPRRIQFFGAHAFGKSRDRRNARALLQGFVFLAKIDGAPRLGGEKAVNFCRSLFRG